MKERIILGLGKFMVTVPPWLVGMKNKFAKSRMRYEANMQFMTDDHRRVHHYVVRELPGAGRPLSPESISDALGFPKDRVTDLLTDLERHMTFLFRNKDGHVTWAYPVTVDETPHHLTFSTGERVYAA